MSANGRRTEGSSPHLRTMVRTFLTYTTLLFFLLPREMAAQDSTSRDTTDRFYAFPVIFYTPETELGLGAASLYNFYFPGERTNTKPSQVGVGGAYTFRDQILSYIPFELFMGGDRFWVFGELGYYDYLYEFYGVGNTTEPSDQEFFTGRYPRVRINGLYQLEKKLYVGVRYAFDEHHISDPTKGGVLDKKAVKGSNGGTISDIGIMVRYDSRDRIYYPSKGWLIEGSSRHSGNWSGSDFSFTKVEADLSQYTDLGNEHILALNANTELTFGDPPFNETALLGGPKQMRGYYKGRYRDAHFWTAQAEYRKILFWRVGVAAFGGMGAVSPSLEEVFENDPHYSYGGGLRVVLDKKKHLNLRTDIAFGEAGPEYYLTYREAF